jgi:PadR family transcriptional regulator, regulatory protein AphA
VRPARKLAATEAAVLGLLADGEHSGYDLKRAIDRSVGYFWGPAKSRIYTVLPHLVELGYATRRDVIQQNRPNKQLYRITAAGRQALEEWLAEPSGPTPDRNPLLLKVFFGDYASPETVLEHVRARRAEAEQLKRELDEIDRTVRRRDEAERYSALTRVYGREWADAMIRWADHVERELAADAGTSAARAGGREDTRRKAVED